MSRWLTGFIEFSRFSLSFSLSRLGNRSNRVNCSAHWERTFVATGNLSWFCRISIQSLLSSPRLPPERCAVGALPTGANINADRRPADDSNHKMMIMMARLNKGPQSPHSTYLSPVGRIMGRQMRGFSDGWNGSGTRIVRAHDEAGETVIRIIIFSPLCVCVCVLECLYRMVGRVSNGRKYLNKWFWNLVATTNPLMEGWFGTADGWGKKVSRLA